MYVPFWRKRMKRKGIKKLGCVYCIQVGNFYKIGATTNITKRIKCYECHNPEFKILGICTTMRSFDLESFLHKKYKNKRFKNEWFILNNREKEYVRYLLNNIDGAVDKLKF